MDQNIYDIKRAEYISFGFSIIFKKALGLLDFQILGHYQWYYDGHLIEIQKTYALDSVLRFNWRGKGEKQK
jgi:hypothetical protein